MGHAGDIDLHHQIVGQVGVNIGAVGAVDQALGIGEIGFEKVEGGRPGEPAQSLAIAFALVVLAKKPERRRVTPRRRGLRRLQHAADPAELEAPLHAPRGEGQEPPDRRAPPIRKRVEPGQPAHRPVASIAEEALVAAVAGQGHLDAAPRQLGDIPGRDRRGVGEGLAIVPHQPRQDCDRIGLDDQLLVIGAVALRHHPGIAGLVVFAGGKADREGLHPAARGPRHHRHDRGRVDPAREKRAQRRVRDQAQANRVFEP